MCASLAIRSRSAERQELEPLYEHRAGPSLTTDAPQRAPLTMRLLTHAGADRARNMTAWAMHGTGCQYTAARSHAGGAGCPRQGNRARPRAAGDQPSFKQHSYRVGVDQENGGGGISRCLPYNTTALHFE